MKHESSQGGVVAGAFNPSHLREGAHPQGDRNLAVFCLETKN